MMQGLEMHTPEGFSDLSIQECARKRRIEQAVMCVFGSFGYREVETPTVEYYDVFGGEAGGMVGDACYRFFDRSGKILTLRPDITAPVTRMAATKFNAEEFPLKLCYLGKVFRYENVYQGVVQREFTQSGVELLGEKGIMADCEIVMMTVQALLACGLTEFQIDLGQAAFFQGLMRAGGIADDTAERIRQAIDRKDTPALEHLMNGLDMDPYWKEIIIKLPQYFGDAAVLDNFDGNRLPEESRDAVLNLREIYVLLRSCGYEKYIAVDLSMVPKMGYYTGMILKGFTRGVGFSICGGGRYDNLVSKFGKDIPATGVAIGIDRVIAALSAISSHAVEDGQKPSDGLVCAREQTRAQAALLARALREEGLVIEQYLGQGDLDAAGEYAKSRQIGGIFYVKEAGKAEVIDLINGTQREADLRELMGGAL